MPPEHMVLKLFSSEAEQRACELAREALGHSTASTSTGPVRDRFTEWDLDALRRRTGRGHARRSFYDGAWAVQYLRSFSHTIAGGTSEIQRNIMAERVLGLPAGEA